MAKKVDTLGVLSGFSRSINLTPPTLFMPQSPFLLTPFNFSFIHLVAISFTLRKNRTVVNHKILNHMIGYRLMKANYVMAGSVSLRSGKDRLSRIWLNLILAAHGPDI